MSERSDWSYFAVIVLLIAQVILFVLSMDAFMAISIFCTATGGQLPPVITLVHVAYLGLFLFGVASLFWPPGRKIYVAAITVALLALPVQLWLLDTGYLHCDGP